VAVRDNARYDAVATFYHSSNPDFVPDQVGTALIRLMGPLGGRRVLDLACGGGRLTRELARRGALVTGIDISRVLLDHAETAERAQPLGVTYLHRDCTDDDVLAGQAFDCVACYFGLTDIDDLDGCLATVARVLPPNGTFTFATLHPCFPGWAGTHSASWESTAGYFEEGYVVATGARSALRQRVGANHRMLSTYLNALLRHRLTVEEVAEPGMPAEWTHEHPDAGPVPVFLVVRARRV